MSARRRKAAWLSRQFVYPQILSNLPQALQNSLPSSAPLFQTDEPRYFLLKFQKLRTAPARASFLFATFDVLRSLVQRPRGEHELSRRCTREANAARQIFRARRCSQSSLRRLALPSRALTQRRNLRSVMPPVPLVKRQRIIQ